MRFKNFKFFILFYSIFLAGCTTIYNPATGRNESIMLSTASEVALGQDLHQNISKEYIFSSDIVKADRLNAIGERLVKVSDRQDYEYHFYLLENKELNAFASPGGYVYFFTGLFDKLRSDDAIAAVLAHEIGHCAARHIAKRFQAALGANILSAIALSQVSPEAQAIASDSSSIAMNLIFSAFSRKDEYQADSLGIKYLFLAGYDPNGMIKSFEILKKEEKADFVPPWFRTHPYIDDRIKRVKEEAALAPYRYSLQSQDTASPTK